MITRNPDGSWRFDKDGLIFSGTRTDDNTLEIIYEGPISNLPWVADGTQIRWRQTLDFFMDGDDEAFVAEGEVTILSGPCDGQIIRSDGASL